jgi:hypothetical protein
MPVLSKPVDRTSDLIFVALLICFVSNVTDRFLTPRPLVGEILLTFNR